MMRKAIDKCGRPIVLSLSCGEAPLGHANHLKQNANMWRVSADFWDDWSDLLRMFDLLNSWSSHIAPNTWPDADMLPIGKISLDDRPHGLERMTKFTQPEQYTLLTLFSIARSPLFIGADLLSMDDFTLSLLTNPEVITVNQNSTDNRQVVQRNGSCVWIATEPSTNDKYIALFNLKEKEAEVIFDLELEHLRGKYKVRDLWSKKDIGTVEKNLKMNIPPHGAGLYRLSKL